MIILTLLEYGKDLYRMKKIFLNKKPVSGPWGGGNKFVRDLHRFLISKDYLVTFNLTRDVDLIFCFDPRPNDEGLWYQHFLNHKNTFGSKIIQRVGDVGTHSKPELTELVKQSTKFSDFVIFPSIWSKDYIKFANSNFRVIPNAPQNIFYENKKSKKAKKEKALKIVTHHWSTNNKKGFDYYERLGQQIKDGVLKNVEFTYIGRFNDNFSQAGINLKKPMDENSLSFELPEHHLYLTASIEEAGANHVLEAMAAGLPVIYRSGGGSSCEYCAEHGRMFNSVDEMISVIKEYCESPDKIFELKNNYNEKIEDVIIKYEEIIRGQLES